MRYITLIYSNFVIRFKVKGIPRPNLAFLPPFFSVTTMQQGIELQCVRLYVIVCRFRKNAEISEDVNLNHEAPEFGKESTSPT